MGERANGTQGDRHFGFTDQVIADWEIREAAKTPLWGPDGRLNLDFGLLGELLTVPTQAGDLVTTGRYAGAVEMWVAHELRRAGFADEHVWPRRTRPRVLSPDLAILLSELGECPPELERVLCRGSLLENRVWGSAYTKQVDAGLASSWVSGPEALVSVKTQSSSFGKNINNRIEESYGDGKNLKRRFPLAFVGYLMVLRDTILTEEPQAFRQYVHTLGRYVDSKDAYDSAALLLVHWQEDGSVLVSEEGQKPIPEHLSAERFFEQLIRNVLDAAPHDRHKAARALRGEYDVRVTEIAY